MASSPAITPNNTEPRIPTTKQTPDRNLFDIDPHVIHETKVQLTIMDGKVVHD